MALRATNVMKTREQGGLRGRRRQSAGRVPAPLLG